MKNLQEWLERECQEAHQILWVVNHINEYHSVDESTKILDDLKRYSQNIYTYATEAARTYHELYQKCCCNPIIKSNPYLIEGKYSILCDRQEGLLVEVLEQGKKYIVPVGLLDEAPEEYHAECAKVKKDIENRWKEEYQEICKKISKLLEWTENRCRTRRAEVNEQCMILNEVLKDGANTLKLCMLGGILSFVLMCCIRKPEYAVVCGILLCGFSFNTGKKISNSTYNNDLLERIDEQAEKLKWYRKNLELNSEVHLDLDYVISRCGEYTNFYAIDRDMVQAEKLMKEVTKPACTEENFGKAKRNLVIVTVCFIVGAVGMFLTKERTESVVETTENYEPAESEVSEKSAFDENGFVFADSNSRYLTEEEVYALQDMEEYDFQTMLGFARNELYARHGFAFNEKGQYYPFYMQYDWYKNVEHHVVKDSELNEYEKANRDLIVGIERKEGYRQ